MVMVPGAIQTQTWGSGTIWIILNLPGGIVEFQPGRSGVFQAVPTLGLRAPCSVLRGPGQRAGTRLRCVAEGPQHGAALDPVGRSSADDAVPRGFGDGEVDPGAQGQEQEPEPEMENAAGLGYLEPGRCKAGEGAEAEQEPEPSCHMGRIGLMS